MRKYVSLCSGFTDQSSPPLDSIVETRTISGFAMTSWYVSETHQHIEISTPTGDVLAVGVTPEWVWTGTGFRSTLRESFGPSVALMYKELPLSYTPENISTLVKALAKCVAAGLAIPDGASLASIKARFLDGSDGDAVVSFVDAVKAGLEQRGCIDDRSYAPLHKPNIRAALLTSGWSPDEVASALNSGKWNKYTFSTATIKALADAGHTPDGAVAALGDDAPYALRRKPTSMVLYMQHGWTCDTLKSTFGVSLQGDLDCFLDIEPGWHTLTPEQVTLFRAAGIKAREALRIVARSDYTPSAVGVLAALKSPLSTQ